MWHPSLNSIKLFFISDFTPLCTLQLIRAHFYVKQKIFPWRDFMEIESPLIIFRLTISSFYDATLFCHRAYTYILGMYVHIYYLVMPLTWLARKSRETEYSEAACKQMLVIFSDNTHFLFMYIFFLVSHAKNFKNEKIICTYHNFWIKYCNWKKIIWEIDYISRQLTFVNHGNILLFL